ncbi:MAG: putative lipid II flippase FtsW [Pseudonocardia sp.]|uniref:putative lipid II flippase FtsW n=1 Tax=unclassified Pseudonocardia TaxID=2619320 RepID=UPI00086E6895|nr:MULTISPECIES: putative lipid II flippase FtsW [unclassified Pseudonocardia]MBN9107778.1 putative lipid II flippase FtsW [Pseudonocardia sp.]ODU03417.1 MAG: cell division protein FtsW [Pseudonocardia sp. SCN 72-51]ODV07517.1 MAG: cell division protein FtsW [Pseudonocardia sp. SCN 73-27]
MSPAERAAASSTGATSSKAAPKVVLRKAGTKGAAAPQALTGVRASIGRAGTALAQWLRRPLTSLHLVLGVFGLLTTFGLVMVLSASSVESLTSGGSSYSVFTRQVMFCAVGLVVFYVGLRIKPTTLRAVSPVLLIVCAVLLALVLIPGLGSVRGGSRAWFTLGPFAFQPGEPAKVALALWGAHVLATRRKVMHRWKHALSPVVPVALVLATLMVLEPDLGMTVSLGIVLIALLFFAGARGRLLLALAGGGLAGALILGLTAGYRQSRITSFLSAGSDPLGPGYQATQALYSLADGGLFGVGLGQGRAKWSYLPNAHNDFIFAIIGEELGFIGAFAVLALFATLAYTGLRIATRSADPWLRIVCSTLTAWLVVQAAINIGYVVGLLPVTGLQLPLISSGGTSLVVTMFAFGVLANAARHEPEAVAVLRNGGQGRIARLLRLPVPEPYRAPAARPPAQRVRR